MKKSSLAGELMPPLGFGLRSMEEAKVVVRIFQAAAQGLDAEDIAGQLNAEGLASPGGRQWRGQTVRRILTHPILETLLTGHTTNGHGSFR
jgi:Recombinase